MPAFIAKGAGKAVSEDSAREILAQIMFHIGGHGIAQGVLPARLREIGLYVLLHRLIEHGSLRASAPINTRGWGRRRFSGDTSVGRRHPCRPLSSRFGLCLKGNEPSGDRQCSRLSETSAWDRFHIGSPMSQAASAATEAASTKPGMVWLGENRRIEGDAMQPEHGLGARQGPMHASALHTILDHRLAGTLDYSGSTIAEAGCCPAKILGLSQRSTLRVSALGPTSFSLPSAIAFL
jgi:hypothetical protein